MASTHDQKWFRERVEFWAKLFGFWPYEFTIRFHDYYNPEASLDIEQVYPYRRAIIQCYKGFWDKDESLREKYIIHELCHLTVWPMDMEREEEDYDKWNNVLEASVDTIALAVANVRDHYMSRQAMTKPGSQTQQKPK